MTGPGELAFTASAMRNINGEKRISPGQETSMNLVLRLILIWVIIVTLLQIYSFGALDNIFKVDHRFSTKPLPVFLKDFLEKRGLTPPVWLLRWAYLAELNPIERSFMTVYRSLKWLGEKASPSQTPAEAADVLARRLPDASQEIHSLLHEYQRHLYGQKHGYPPLVHHAVKIIQREAMRVTIQQRWRAFQGILRLGPQ